MRPETPIPGARSRATLSPADRQLLRRVLAGHSLVEIAAQECLSREAIQCWLTRVLQEVQRARAVPGAARPGGGPARAN
jgi:hypothetical protein